MSVLFRGSKLKGYWTFKRDTQADKLWKMKNAVMPSTKKMQMTEMQLANIIKGSLNNDSRKSIAETAHCGKSTVYFYQRKFGLL